jgi:DNA-binding CsgD family transcriptional regulator
MSGLNGLQLQDRLSELGCRTADRLLERLWRYSDNRADDQGRSGGLSHKAVTKDRLLKTIERALDRYETDTGARRPDFTDPSLFAQLTPRERQVFDLLVRGKPHKQISHDLGISERTVKLHRHQLVEKLRARSLADLAVIAERLGLFRESGGNMLSGTEHTPGEAKRLQSRDIVIGAPAYG